jgi:hypothetical protein
MVISEFFPTSMLIFMAVVGAIALATHPAILAAAADRTVLVRAVLTPCLAAVALYVIVSKEFAEGDKRWAYGLIGMVAGTLFKCTPSSWNDRASKRAALVR